MPKAFAGRQSELAALSAAFAAATAAKPQVVLLHGDAGIGKSWLIAEFLRRHAGLPVIAAAGAEGEAELSYGVVHLLAVDALARGRTAGLPHGAAAVLADLQPERLPATADPLAVGAGLRALFAALAAGSPAVVVAEDMQWADPPSASALLFACRRLADDRLLVLLSCTAEPSKGLPPAWVRFIDGDRRASAIWLGGLADLTAQELRVARLVALGKSNRETAVELYLSPKTVEYHLGHAYAKLGVRTRYQLTMLVRAASVG
jgi:DNA-binding CsgD family transcriptional regulator